MKALICVLALAMFLNVNAGPLDFLLGGDCNNDGRCNEGKRDIGRGANASGQASVNFTNISAAIAQPFITSFTASALPFQWIINWFGG